MLPQEPDQIRPVLPARGCDRDLRHAIIMDIHRSFEQQHQFTGLSPQDALQRKRSHLESIIGGGQLAVAGRKRRERPRGEPQRR